MVNSKQKQKTTGQEKCCSLFSEQYSFLWLPGPSPMNRQYSTTDFHTIKYYSLKKKFKRILYPTWKYKSIQVFNSQNGDQPTCYLTMQCKS